MNHKIFLCTLWVLVGGLFTFAEAKEARLPFDLELTKTVSNTNPGQNSNITFTLTLFNNSATDATGVKVKDLLPAGLSFVSSNGNYSSSTGIWNVETIYGNQSLTLDIVATVTGSVGATITNYAQVQVQIGSDLDSTAGNNSQNEDDDDSVSITVGAPTGDADVSVSKIVSNASPNPNGSITYTISVTNNGPDNLSSLTIFDDLPAPTQFTYTSHTGTGVTYSGGNITWNVGALNNGQSKSITITGTAGQDHTNCAVVQNAGLPDSNSSNNEDCASVDVQEPPPTTTNVSITKTVSNEAPALNTNFYYTILVANDYPAATTTTLNVTDQLPPGITFISYYASQGTYNVSNGVWTIGALPQGVTAELSLTVKATTAGIKNNCAAITTVVPTDPNTTDHSSCAEINAGAIDLEVTKVAVGGNSALSNSNKTFNITIYNNSGTVATGVSIEELVPAGWSYVSHSAPAGTTYTSGTRIWNIGDVNAAETKTLSLVLKAPTVTSNQGYSNCATLKTASPNTDIDSIPGNGNATEDDLGCVSGTVYSAIPDLKVTKTMSPTSPIAAGSAVTFTITVTNEGNAPATNIVVSDQLPAGFTLASGSASTTITTLAVGASTTVTLIGILQQSGQNCAQIQTMTEPDLDSTPGNGYNNSEDDKSCISYQVINPVCNLATNMITNGGFESLDFSSPTYTLYNSQAKYLPLTPTHNNGWSYAGPIGGVGAASGVKQISGNGDPWDGSNFGYVRGENACIQAGNSSATPKRFAISPNTSYITCINAAAYNTVATPQTPTSFKIELVFYDSAVGGTTYIEAYDHTAPENVGGWNNLNWATYCQTFSTPIGFGYVEVYYTVTAAASNEGLALDGACLSIPTNPTDLELSKVVVGSSTKTLNQDFTFEITVTNNSTVNATGVTVKDVLPVGLSYVSHTAPAGTTFASGTKIWTVGNLAAGQSKTLTLVLKGVVAGSQNNCAEVSYSSPYDNDSTPNNNNPSEDDYDCATVTVLPPPVDLEIAKTVSNASLSAGQTFSYTVTVTNTSANNATNVQVKDLIPVGISFVNATVPSGTSYTQSSGIWNIGNLNAGQNKVLVLNVSAPTNISNPTTYTNCAEVFNAFESDIDSTPGNNSSTEDDDDCEPVTVTPPQIDLSVDKAIDNPTQNIGGNVIYTITVTNTSSIPATGVSIADKLPACLTYVSDNSSSGGGSSLCGNGVRNVGEDCDGGIECTASCTCVTSGGGDLGGGGKKRILEEADNNVSLSAGGGTNAPNACPTGNICGNGLTELGEACDDGNTVDTDSCTNTCTVNSGGGGGLGGRKRESGGNNGILVGSYDQGTGVWTIGTIAAGQTVTLQITATVNGSCNNCAEVKTANESDSDSTPNNQLPEDDYSCATVNPPNAPKIDLELAKTVNNANPGIGGQVTFTLTVSNTSAVNATGVKVTDLLTGDISGVGLVYVSHSTASGTYDNASGIWNVGNLNAGASATLSLTALAYPGKGGGASVNCAEVSLADQSDSDSTPNNSSTTEDDDACATVNPTCQTPSFTLGFTPATCNLTTGFPLNNAKLDLTAISNTDKADYSIGASYTGVVYSAATPISGTTYSFINIPNPTASQAYTVRAFNGGDGCFYDQSVNITPTTQPSGSAVGANPTCNTTAGGVNSDGSVTLSGFGTTDKFGIAVGSSYSGNTPSGSPVPTDYASAAAIPAGGIIINNLPNPTTSSQIYTVRVFNSSGCFIDKVVTINQVTGCTPPPTCSLNAPTTSATCNNNGTPSNPADDTFSYNITVTGTNTGASYGVSGGDTRSGLAYGSSQGAFGTFLISGGNLSLNITDVSNAGCTTSTTVNAPAACSSAGNLTISKNVTGKPSGFTSPSFSIVLDCSDNTFDQTISLSDGGSQTISNIPNGTTCTITEPTTPAAPSGYTYGTPIIVTSPVTITTGTTTTVSVTNPLTALPCSINAFTVTPSCNNNNTANTTSDDYRTFSLNLNGTSVSSPYTVSVNNGGTITPTSGTYGSATAFQLQSGSAGNGTTYTLTVTDASGSTCTQSATISDPGTCSNPTVGAITIAKSVTGKPSGFTSPSFSIVLDCSDNTFDQTITLMDGESQTINNLPAGTTCTVSEPTLPNPPAGYTYGTPTISPSGSQSVSAGSTINVTVTNPLSQIPCTINSFTVSPVCNNNGTNNTAADDYRTFSINVNGSGTALTYQASVNNGGTLNPTVGTFGTATNFNLQSGSAGNTTVYTLTLTDANNSACTQTTTISDPGSCSTPVPTCSLNAPVTAAVCNTNNTPTDASDDYFTYVITTTGNNVGSGYDISGGDTRSGLSYGTQQGAFGNFPMSGGNLSLTITDATYAGCTVNTSVTKPQPCATTCTPPVATVDVIKATCSGATANADGILLVSGNVSSDRFDLSTGSTYTGTATYATASVIPTNGIIRNNLPNPVATQAYTVRIFGADGCFVDRTISLQPTICSATCSMQPPQFYRTCNDNGTPGDNSDDTFTYRALVPAGTGTSSTYNISGDDTRSGLAYNTLLPASSPYFGPFPLSVGVLVLHVADAADPNCAVDDYIIAPDDCSGIIDVDPPPAGTCTLTASNVNGTCNDNGTPSNPADDTFSYIVNVTHTGTDPTLIYNISGDDTRTGLTYGLNQGAFGPFPISGGNLALTATDDDVPICNAAFTVIAPATCSNTLPRADLRVQKTVSSTTVTSGQTITYTITVTNDGPDTATNVLIRDVISSMLTYVSNVPSVGSYNLGSGTWTIPTLANGASATLQITVTVN